MINLTSAQKQIILGIKIIFFGLLSWFFLHQLFYLEISIAFIILTVVCLIFWGITICMGTLVLDKKFLYPAFILSLLSFFIFFRGPEVGPANFRVAMYYFLIMILIFIAYIIFRFRVIHDKKTRLKLHFWKIFIKKGLAWVFTMICLLIAFAYYFSPVLGELSAGMAFEIPKGFIDKILEFVDVLGPEATDFTYELINFQLRSQGDVIGEYIPIALAVGLFLFLRVLVVFLIPLIILLSSLLMKLSINLGFLKITTKKIEVEDIEL